MNWIEDVFEATIRLLMYDVDVLFKRCHHWMHHQLKSRSSLSKKNTLPLSITTVMAVHLAKVLGGVTIKQTIKVAAPYFKFDDFLMCHFRENNEIMVHDPQEKAKPGDWVLVRELREPLSIQVKHQLLQIVYKNGHMTDPLTGRKCIGTEFADQVDQETQLFGWKPITERSPSSEQK